MQPYQQASDEIQRQGEIPLNIGTGIASTAASTAFGGLALNRILPFLSKYIPQNLAIKGLNKIDPRFGAFISKAMSEGKTFDEVKEFIKEKASGNESQSQENDQSEPTKQNGNVIEQYDPELFTYLKESISKGIPLLQAGQKAMSHQRFSNAINKMEKDHKTPWINILQSVFGGQGQEQPQEQQSQQPQQQSGQGQGQQALMAILQQVRQSRGQK